jgi:hypothetical protein
MSRKTVMIVPQTVPDALVTRLAPAASDEPLVISAAPAAVPTPIAVPVVPEQLTAEQVALLREENEALRQELARVRQRS